MTTPTLNIGDYFKLTVPGGRWAVYRIEKPIRCILMDNSDNSSFLEVWNAHMDAILSMEADGKWKIEKITNPEDIFIYKL